VPPYPPLPLDCEVYALLLGHLPAPAQILPALHLTASPQVEEGWECTNTSPSVCTRRGSAAPAKPHDSPDAPSGGGGPPPPAPAPHKKGHSGWGVAILVLAVTGAVLGGLYVSRDRIYDHFPRASQPADARPPAMHAWRHRPARRLPACMLMTACTCLLLPLQVESVVDAVASRLPGHRHRYTFAGGRCMGGGWACCLPPVLLPSSRCCCPAAAVACACCCLLLMLTYCLGTAATAAAAFGATARR
jgi:hypothetical protein